MSKILSVDFDVCSPATRAKICLVLALLAVLAYFPSLSLPFISDDYLQIDVARHYGPASGWSALALDELYLCRATSVLLTHWTEEIFGLDPVVFRLSSLFFHIVNVCLIFALGRWKVIGWRAAAIAAGFFAVDQAHQEAVMWYAAVHEVLVFCFALLSMHAWLLWLDSRRERFLWHERGAVSSRPVFQGVGGRHRARSGRSGDCGWNGMARGAPASPALRADGRSVHRADLHDSNHPLPL